MSADSGGIPFTGRELRDSGFAGDRGDSDPRVLAALHRLGQEPGPASEAELIDVLLGARVIVPVVAAPAGAAVHHHGDHDDSPRHADEVSSGSEMATVVLTAPDGRRALPVFSGVQTLAAWDASARPVPVTTPEVARSTIEDGCETLLVDLDSPHAAALRLSHVWALAQARAWQPGHTDPVVRLAVAEAAQGLDGLVRATIEDGSVLHGPGVLRLVLVLCPGLTPEVVERIVQSVGERLAVDPEVRIRIDDLAVVVHRAEDPVDAV